MGAVAAEPHSEKTLYRDVPPAPILADVTHDNV